MIFACHNMAAKPNTPEANCCRLPAAKFRMHRNLQWQIRFIQTALVQIREGHAAESFWINPIEIALLLARVFSQALRQLSTSIDIPEGL